MAWQTITAAMTDANSPLNQLLFDYIRECLDDLHQAGAQLLYINGSVTQNLTAFDVTLDSHANRDWRDRVISVEGLIYNVASANVGKRIPGGAADNTITSQIAAGTGVGNAEEAIQIAGWFYSSVGGANKTTPPFLTWGYGGSYPSTCWLWVNTTGDLMLSYYTAKLSGYRNLDYNLRLTYSADQGGH
jgi:hypothetical protein